MSQIYVIGDIHGCLGPLKRLMAKVKPDLDHHKLIFIGDYIDRGPDSRRVIDYIIHLKKHYPPENIICLMGNHERMFLDFLNGDNQLLFLINGGRATLESYWGENWENQPRQLPSEHWEFFQQLKLIYETEDYIFVHGGLKPGIPLAEQQEEDVLWIREEFLICLDDFGKRVIFGHTPFPKPFVWPNKIGIDTGAVYGNYLTCLKLPEEIFYWSR
ncbi:MAG: serine/threonine protein phosphatase [Deltaproteobacteria bacterium]|nr:serine/threonine protein phosphatase [Deltaproteobacteria bacterium]MBW1953357.1 serine/threonine protein phosphatase [Deltaproteobacteria bacterium]MBW1986718.1 serine/threonine protein phosphatase [Deltaproteobacteria bacterium]MBW2134564.1 serine/threonine protein phosphatase [Deltaproteobacteria bacterium]